MSCQEVCAQRREVARDRVTALVDRAQCRAKATPPREIRKLIREAVAAARAGKSKRV